MGILIASLLLSGVTVTLPMEAEAAGMEVELGEIAEVVGSDAELVARVRAVELGYAPSPGYSRLFRAFKISELLARELPGVDVRLVGHAACRVRPEVLRVAPAEIEGFARAELARAHGAAEATFELRNPIEEVAIPVGAGPHRLRARLEGDVFTSGTTSVPVEILVDGAPYRTVWTSWSVEVWRSFPVLARPVKAGEALSAEMFESQPVKWLGSSDAQPLDATRLVGAVAARDLAPGTTVTGFDVRRSAVIQAAESVFLCVRKGPIQAKVPAIALEAGAVGDRIRVRIGGPAGGGEAARRVTASNGRSADMGQELTALVLHRDLVEIDLGN